MTKIINWLLELQGKSAKIYVFLWMFLPFVFAFISAILALFSIVAATIIMFLGVFVFMMMTIGLFLMIISK